MCYCALQHHSEDCFLLSIPPPIKLYVGLSYLLLQPGVTTHGVMMAPQVLQQPKGRQHIAAYMLELMVLSLVKFTHQQQQTFSCTPALKKVSKPEQKCAGSITSVWSLAKKRLTQKLSRVQIKFNFIWNM